MMAGAMDVISSAVGDLAVPGLVALGCVLAFFVLLAVQAKSDTHGHAVLEHRLQQLGDHGEKEIEATKFVSEGEHLVRRSTRCVGAVVRAAMHAAAPWHGWSRACREPGSADQCC
jgi:hypothetical protein